MANTGLSSKWLLHVLDACPLQWALVRENGKGHLKHWRAVKRYSGYLMLWGASVIPPPTDLVYSPVFLLWCVWTGAFQGFRSVSRVNLSQDPFLGLGPFLCTLRAGPWDKAHSLQHLPLLCLPLNQPRPPIWRSRTHFPLNLWQVNKEKKAPFRRSPFRRENRTFSKEL